MAAPPRRRELQVPIQRHSYRKTCQRHRRRFLITNGARTMEDCLLRADGVLGASAVRLAHNMDARLSLADLEAFNRSTHCCCGACAVVYFVDAAVEVGLLRVPVVLRIAAGYIDIDQNLVGLEGSWCELCDVFELACCGVLSAKR